MPIAHMPTARSHSYFIENQTQRKLESKLSTDSWGKSRARVKQGLSALRLEKDLGGCAGFVFDWRLLQGRDDR